MKESNAWESAELDGMLRQRHIEAVSSLSARTRAQLHNRTAAVLAAPATRRPAHRITWTVAATCTALLAMTVGLQLRPQLAPPKQNAVMSPVDATANDGDAVLATLDENPDLYLWLASKDAVALVTE